MKKAIITGGRGSIAQAIAKELSKHYEVLSPTKELTMQTAKVFEKIGDMMDGLRIQTQYGGSNIEEGSSFSNKNVPHVLCGCPGRIYDMMRRDRISVKKIKELIVSNEIYKGKYKFKLL